MRRLIVALLLSGLLGDALAAEPEARNGGRGAEGTCPPPGGSPAYYVASQIDLVGLIAPPPAAGSPEQQADLDAVLAAQRAALANGTLERALADTEMTCARFKDVLGPELKSAPGAKALKFISEAAGSASQAAAPPKRYWKRPRPFLVSTQVERRGDVAVGGSMAWGEYPEKRCEEAPPKNDEEAAKRRAQKEKAANERNNTAYPSGHAAFGMACAVLLAEVVPEKRAELFARGRQYGESRVIVGAHFPSDVVAGQQAALLGAALVMQNASFARQFVGAQGELRRALGLPAEIPDLEPNKDLFKEKDGKDAPPDKGGRPAGGRPPSR